MNYSRPVLAAVAAALCVAFTACGTTQLRRSTIATGHTATDIIYSMVLDNVAMAKDLPGSLPWHIKITQGAITIQDSVTPTLGYMHAAAITKSIQLAGTQSAQVSWTVVPVVDKPTLQTLQMYYANAASGDDPTYKKFFSVSAPGNGMPCGSFGKTKVCVTDMSGFIALVEDVLSATAVTAEERGIQVPGPQPNIATP
jgi:hypothetical protein